MAVCLSLTPLSMAREQPAPAKDTLPMGALARLGVVKGKVPSEGHTARVSAVAFSPDGKLVATGSWDHTISLWDAATGKLLLRLEGHTNTVFYVAFSPDGKTLASSSRDHSVRLWNVKSGKQLLVLRGHTDEVFGVAFAPDGKTLASGGFDKVARLWDTASGQEVRCFEGLDAGLTTVVFTPDGKTLVAGCKNGQIATWDVKTGKELRRFTGHTGWVYPLAISPDGKMLATGGVDCTIRLWELVSGKMRRQLPSQGGDVFSVAFSPDGRMLASTCKADNLVRLWDVADGKSRGNLKGHENEIFRVAFSADGKRLVSGSEDHTALIWDMTRTAATPTEPVVLKPAEAEKLWSTLAKTDAEAAYTAIVGLTQASPASTLPTLEKLLQSPSLRGPSKIAPLIADLDNDEFDMREKASAALEKAGLSALSELRKTAKSSPSVEARRRATELLQKLDADDWVPPEELRLERTIEVLERIGTPEARTLLEELVKGKTVIDVSEQAQASLGRLKSR